MPNSLLRGPIQALIRVSNFSESTDPWAQECQIPDTLFPRQQQGFLHPSGRFSLLHRLRFGFLNIAWRLGFLHRTLILRVLFWLSRRHSRALSAAIIDLDVGLLAGDLFAVLRHLATSRCVMSDLVNLTVELGIGVESSATMSHLIASAVNDFGLGN